MCVYGDGLLQKVVGGERPKALKTAHLPIIHYCPLGAEGTESERGRRDGRNKRDSGQTMKVRRELTALMVGRREDGCEEWGGGKSVIQQREKRGFKEEFQQFTNR